MGRLRLFSTLPILILSALLNAGVISFNTAKITKVHCNFNQDWVQNDTCKLKAINRNRHELTIKGFVTKSMENVWVHLKTYKFYRVYRPFIFAFSANICDLFNNKPYTNFAALGTYEAIKTFTNLNHSCPYEGWMFLEKAVFVRDYLRLVVPPGRYRADFNVSDGIDKNPVLQVNVYIDMLEFADL